MSESEPKKETVRITLPTRPSVGEADAAPPKKETVRINLPSRPTLGSAPAEAPKKETGKLSNLAKPPVLTPRPLTPPLAQPASSLAGSEAAADVGSAAPAVPVPRPPTAPSMPAPPSRPMPPPGGLGAGARPPSPPSAPSAPTVGGAPKPPGAPGVPPSAPVAPARPAAPPTAAPATPMAKVPTAASGDLPTAVKPTVKKDTVRIEVPGGGKTAPPQATVRIQHTQPVVRPPEAQVRTLAKVESADVVSLAEEDPMLLYTSAAVLLFSVILCLIEALTYFAN